MKVFCATKIVIFWTLGVGFLDYWNVGFLERWNVIAECIPRLRDYDDTNVQNCYAFDMHKTVTRLKRATVLPNDPIKST